MILNVGCGPAPLEGAVNLDMTDGPGIDVVHNLDVFPWPFEDSSFDEVRAIQVFEHVGEPVGFMNEAWRVLVPGGLLMIYVPHWKSQNSFTDPTHKRHCTEETFDYWCPGTPLGDRLGIPMRNGCSFHKEYVTRVGDDLHAMLYAIKD